MTQSVANLIETLVSLPNSAVPEAGEVMLQSLSGGSLTAEVFRKEPETLTGPDYAVSRYLAQVVWRALGEKYEAVDEIIAALYSVLDRNPPTIESREKNRDPKRLVFPELKILRVRQPVEVGDGFWQSSFEAQVTTGPMRDQEVEVCLRSAVNPTACFIVSYLWVHASVAAYNLVPVSEELFEDCTETFLVLEPLRQVNATSVTRALHCPKPVIDQIRRGRGDVTIHTLKGMLIHALFDRMLDGGGDIESHYEETIADYLVQIAAVTDSFFDEAAFRDDVLKHASAIKEFFVLNPQMCKNPQVELKRYSATLGIQGRIDAVFRGENRLDIVELKTGKRLRVEDHRQLFIYRLLLSDWIRRREHEGSDPIEVTTCLLSSYDGTSSPSRPDADFAEVLEARNRLIAFSYSLGQRDPHVAMRYAEFDSVVCDSCPKWTHKSCVESSKLFADSPQVEAGEALEYFRYFSRRVQAEKWLSDRDLVDLLDDSRLGFRMRKFKTIADAKCVGFESGHFLFNFHENRSDLSVNDRVLVHSGLISSSLIFHGYVRAIDSMHARISIPLKNVSMTEFEDQLWIIDRVPSDVTSEASQTALYDFLVSPEDERKRVILGDLNPLVNGDTEDARGIEFRNALNKSQKQAIQKAAHCRTFHLIWGPPGTGKTKVVPEVVRNVEGAVLLGAFTNTAVDKMLMAILANDPKATFLRIGHSKGSPELARQLGNRACRYFSEDLASSIRNPIELRARLDGIPVVAATAHRAASHPYLRGRNFEMAIVDEAAQLTEPLTLGLVMRANRFVLVGDDFQLPPVVRSDGLLRSMFERLKIHAETEAPECLTMLETQYRMHPEIMEVSNRLYYSGRLSSGVQPEERKPPVGGAILFVPNEETCDGRSNQSEASTVREVVENLLRHVPAEEIGVISPFRAQVVLLNRLLEGTGVIADTVERFQGGERDVIVISFVRSQGSEFVFDDRRFNVALTRARRKLVMVAHPNLFHGTKYEWICDFTEALKTKTQT